MTTDLESRIACSRETRQILKNQKRGGERYEDLLRKMVDQYDPDAAAQTYENND